MEASNVKAISHARSNSLPSGSHPLIAMQMDKLKVLDKDQDLVTMVDMLKEVESISFTMFKSLLSFVCPVKARSNSTGCSLVSKLVQSKRVSCEEEMDNLGKLDGALNALISNKKCIDVIQVQQAQKGLKALESTMQEIKEGLQCVSSQRSQPLVYVPNDNF